MAGGKGRDEGLEYDPGHLKEEVVGGLPHFTNTDTPIPRLAEQANAASRQPESSVYLCLS